MRKNRVIRYRSKRRHLSHSTFELPLTSLMDAMVIILVFLLKSYSSSPVEFETLKGLELPISAHPSILTESKQVLVTESQIQFEGKPYSWKETASDGTLPALAQAFRAVLTDPKASRPLAIQSDRRVPYSQLRRILTTAGKAGFTEFRFLALKPE